MKKENVEKIISTLGGVFTDKPALNFRTPFELLIAVILSAQCTDERVNKITARLFENYNTPEKILTLTQAELEKYIFSAGLYKSKAEHILSACRDIVEKFSGQVPDNLADLQSLAGVGRKTANVVYSVAFGGDAIAVDTHVFRVANRIGLAKADTPLKTELQLMKAIDKSSWSKSHHYLIYLGRSYCDNCPINTYCEKRLKD